ncbi:alanine--tRNA ligase [Melioribacteraceae bacterium 4301-Me]|uniref:alanine--tRNA ligase n=1 Tax=Pyranulibacter aquaticus TaxID=3163344 RepID=UPI0035998EC2
MTSNEIRQQFLDFFKEKGHKIVPSAPVIPYDDPTLLFTNAGMNQFKDVFLGKGTREYNRVADTQKCIRVSGKHNDLEEVGYDTYHHTFFEMLGNWSFGDPNSDDGIGEGYYKKEAIKWAWELLTVVWKLPKERLWATVYRNDDEAFNYWKSETDINPSHILRFDEKDNFWEMGETGPCGPCSEIHINLSDDYENPAWVNANKPECIEIWNLVFIQYNRDETGRLNELPAKHVDTGMGFERICAVLQKKNSNYDTDIFTPLIKAIELISGKKYELDEYSPLRGETQIAMRVIADHIRTLTFAIADGAIPGNEGRGYVLRRILRRAARYGRKLDLKEPFLYKLVDVLVENMSHVFPEIKTNKSNIEKIIKSEEENFNITLDRGIELFENIVSKNEVQSSKIISGDDVFKLYDTFGFPVDLTNLLAKEKGFSIDEKRFNELMNEQKERARKSTKEKLSSVNFNFDKLSNIIAKSKNPTEFCGYDQLRTESVVVGTKNENGNTFIILDKTPFYVESGGQVNDKGIIIIGDTHLKVIDLVKINNQIIHVVENESNTKIIEGMQVIAQVDEKRRWDIMRNHSATHFLHAALREILGKHVQQAGSFVGPEYLRFDFNHFEKLKESEIEAIESLVNEKIRENLPLVHHRNTPFEKAKKMGALMFFGDKYGDKVNVVQFGNFTMEFCGGTHVKNSSQIGLFKIVSESSVASGVRRIEAVTGAGVEKYINQQEIKIKNAESKIDELNEEKKKLEKLLSELRLKEKLSGLEKIVSNATAINSIKIFKGKINAENMDELKSMGDELRIKMKSGVGILFSIFDNKVGIVCVVSDDLIKQKKLAAGKIVSEVAKIVGGGGGGKQHLATAGGKDITKINEALEKVDEIVSKFF